MSLNRNKQMSRIKQFYHLTKPGIIKGNLLTAGAGFFLASRGDISPQLLLATISGLSLIIASGCVVNNYIDRDIDKKMKRTKQRALATGAIPVRTALLYAAVLGVLGSTILGLFTTWQALVAALVGFLFYVVVYAIGKRHTVHGTVIGSISGALPPVVGYTAVTGRVDSGALILFLILVCWQMPHFYAIAIFRLNDYKAAHIPVLPAVKGMRATKIQILLYIVAFMGAVSLLTVSELTSRVFMVIMLLLGTIWLAKGVKGFRSQDDIIWARGMFGFSLVVLTTFCLLLSLDAFLV